MAINKVIYGNNTLIDLTSDTVTQASHIVSGYVGHLANGSVVTGTASGGSSSWTLVASTSYTVSTTSTSSATVATWSTGDSSIWTSDACVYVRIRDTAGARQGYFYGSDNFFVNISPKNGSTATSTSSGVRFYYYYNTSSLYGIGTSNGASGYGVYADYLYNDGRIRIRRRYSSSTSLTINSTYKVEVYLLAPPTGAPIFT